MSDNACMSAKNSQLIISERNQAAIRSKRHDGCWKLFLGVHIYTSHKLLSHLKPSPPVFHPLRGIFPPKYDIFTHFEKESSSDSAKKQVSALETVP